MLYFCRISLVTALISTPMFVHAQITAVQNGPNIEVRIKNQYFTTYISSADEKYPFFYPVNSPGGASVTSMRNGTYPHHSSLFFGCDKVNGGNYWQEGIDRGQILAIQTQIKETGGDRVVIEQECLWHRPGARAPVKDFRTIIISAPSEDIYQIDFHISVEMLMDVTIEKTNHSFFSARMDPDLAVINGGTMINAEGAETEKGTFGKTSPWMDITGKRGNVSEGLCIMQHPDNRWYPAPWFTRDYGFFSPTPMYWPENGEFIRMLKGDVLDLKYRVLAHRGDSKTVNIAKLFEQYQSE